MKKRILSLSVDDYTTCAGGVNKVIMEHALFYEANDIEYVYIYPLQMPKLGAPDVVGKWGGIVNGKSYVFSITRLLDLLTREEFSSIHIHHFPLTRLGEIEQMIRKCSIPIIFVLHDYWTICPKHTIARICKYDNVNNHCLENCEHRALFAGDIFKKMFFDNYARLKVIAPSDVAREVFINFFAFLKDKTLVVPHEEMVTSYPDAQLTISNPIKIAFVGAQTDYKGWYAYKAAADMLKNGNYSFYHLGVGEEFSNFIKQIPINFHKGNKPMINALVNEGIDVAVLNSCIKETYSFTFFECLSAGCFIITCKGSGNIEMMVNRYGNGVVLEDAGEISVYLSGEKFIEDLQNHLRNKKRYEFRTNNELITIIGEKEIETNLVEVSSKAEVLLTKLLRLYKWLAKLGRV